MLRASARLATSGPRLLTPGKVYELQLDRMLTSNVFKKVHRIRVQISGAFVPHFSRNLQTGKSEAYSAATQIGHIRIYHDGKEWSNVFLPVVRR